MDYNTNVEKTAGNWQILSLLSEESCFDLCLGCIVKAIMEYMTAHKESDQAAAEGWFLIYYLQIR